MVSESYSGQCVCDDPKTASRVDCEIPYWLERGTKHSS